MEILKNPAMAPWTKMYPTGAFLFRQGETGRTLFVILEGKVQLISESDSGSHAVAIIPAGEFLGEKALVKNVAHQRAFTARALMPVTAIEIGAKELNEVQRKHPEIVSEILRRSFEVAAGRLDRANYLLAALREPDHRKRAARCLIYIVRNLGEERVEGTVLGKLEQTLQYHMGQPAGQAKSLLDELVLAKALLPLADGDFLLQDEGKVLELLV